MKILLIILLCLLTPILCNAEIVSSQFIGVGYIAPQILILDESWNPAGTDYTWLYYGDTKDPDWTTNCLSGECLKLDASAQNTFVLRTLPSAYANIEVRAYVYFPTFNNPTGVISLLILRGSSDDKAMIKIDTDGSLLLDTLGDASQDTGIVLSASTPYIIWLYYSDTDDVAEIYVDADGDTVMEKPVDADATITSMAQTGNVTKVILYNVYSAAYDIVSVWDNVAAKNVASEGRLDE